MRTEQLQGSKVTLQLLNVHHIADYCAMFSSTVCAALHVRDVTSEHDYLRASLQNKELPFFYVIFDNADNCLIGGLEIRSIDSSRGQLYSWMHERYWGGGRYQEALALISREYFSHNKESYFTAHVDVGNKRSYKALKKFGCADVGICLGPYGKQYKLIIRNRGL